jgi:hypothetical protein
MEDDYLLRFVVLIDRGIIELHMPQPVTGPWIEFGRFDSGNGLSEGPVRSRAVHADKDAEIERGPWRIVWRYSMEI